MKNNSLVKVQIEYKNAVGMSVFVNKKVTEEELSILRERADVIVRRIDNINNDKIA